MRIHVNKGVDLFRRRLEVEVMASGLKILDLYQTDEAA